MRFFFLWQLLRGEHIRTDVLACAIFYVHSVFRERRSVIQTEFAAGENPHVSAPLPRHSAILSDYMLERQRGAN